MREMKRILAMALALALLVGILPMSVFADEYGTAEGTFSSDTVLDAAIFCSDVHGSTSDLTSVLSGVKTSGVTYSSIGFVGDTCLTVANTTSTVKSALGLGDDDNINVMFSYASSHDDEDGTTIKESWNWSGEVEGVSDYYLVYTIRETDMQSDTGADDNFTTWYNGLTDAEKALPIFIMSHRPLHERRNDNAGAAGWYTAISTAAKTSDIVVFWAHNHTGESSVDTAAYYVAKDGSETITIEGGSTVTPNFTYMNAGYINANNQSPKRIGVATTVKITASSLIFQDYNSSGEYSGTYAHNVTVTREFVSVPKTLAVTGKIDYTVGDPIVDPTAVEVTYVDVENPETITTGYSLTKITKGETEYTVDGFTFPEAGTYNLTYTCKIGNYQADAILQVTAEAAVTAGTANCWDDTEMVYIEVATDGVTAVTATNVTANCEKYAENFTTDGYVALDIELTGHTDGNNVEYSISVVPDMDTTNLKLYYVDADGNLVPVEFELTTDELNNVYIEFTSSYVGTFIYGSAAVPEGYTLDTLTLAGIPSDVFEGVGVDMTNAVITATYIKEGAEDFVRVLTVYDYDENNWSYTDKAGKQTFTFTFEGKTATMDIYVWYDEFVVGGEVTVHVGDEEYGVTGANVATSSNNNVAAAIASVIKSGTYVAYDITLSYADGYEANTNIKTVTLPIPEGVTKPVVYYVSEDGATVTNMNATDNGTVTFTTTHFSTYVVGESTEIEVPNPTIAENVTGTTTTTESKEVYVLVSSISGAGDYLIVNTNSATTSAHLLTATNSSYTDTSGVTVTSGTDADGNAIIYIENPAAAAIWTASANGTGYRLYNSSTARYLRYSDNQLTTTGSSSNATTWYSGTNTVYRTNSTRYLRYNNGWGTSSNSQTVYIYQKQTVNFATTTTTTGDYSIAGTPAGVEKVVVSGTTVTLGSTLTFVPESGTTTTTDTSTTATYAVVDGGDPNGIISGISGNTVTFTGKYGKALVKVSYTGTVGETSYTVDNYIVVTAKSPYYEITIKDENDKTVSGTTVSLKGITNGQTVDLSAIVNLITDTGSTEETGAVVEWAIPEEYQNIATVDQNGVVTLKGVDGSFYVMVTYTAADGNDYTAGVNFSVTTSQYSVPSDGSSDFPEYPNEGAVRFDKTATAVGNFSETGITKVELSMTGVPYTTGSEIDVVIMLDMTGSMSSTAMTAAEESAIAFAEQIVKNTDGTYNDNRVAILAFNSGSNSPYTYWSLGTVDSDDEWSSLCTAVRGASDNQVSGGTPYDEALAKCQEILAAAKTDGIGNNRKQFCVFVSDGGPTSYEYITNYDEVKAGTASSYETATASATGGANQSDSNFATIATYTHEYYSTLMKDDGVTMFSVLTGLTAANYPNCTTILQNIASSTDNAYVVEDGSDTTALTNAFSSIAVKILEAATNVVVQDKISDDYTMVFDIPTGSYTDNNTAVAEALKNQEFYIEFLEYALDANHERTTSTSKLKLYLGIDSTTNTYYAASDNAGTKFADPVFTAVATDDAGNATEKGYWSTVDSTYTAAAGEIVINVNDTYYKFIADGSGDYNMTSGAYAYGTIDATTSTSQDLVIVTPYFAYSAATRMLCWTVEKLTTVEYALSYFLFLDQSSTDIGEETEVAAGPYETNDWATLTYTNFNGNDCQQEFPVPQMTWNGAQVSYVFYLVNAAGQPINKSGQVVDFANATFITDVFTHTVVWNGDNAVEELNVSYLATDLLPDAYTIYDANANYTIHVYQTNEGVTVFDYFIIDGSKSGLTSYTTTKVYNTKAGTKYADYGIYSAEAVGTKFETTDADGNTVEIITTKQASLDYSDTTVAFAVVWEPKLVEDTVVVDFGLDVLINVVQNDNLQNTVGGIGLGADAYGSTEMNTGVSTTSKLGTAALTVGGHTISIENENQIRFHQNNMVFTDPVVFYYESEVEFYEGSNKQTGYMYSKVTVIPATTVYYEDEYVTYTDSSKGYDITDDEDNVTGSVGKWTEVGTTGNATQEQDRPGESQISDTIDADNLYGYDSAYESMSTWSMGSAHKVTVASGISGMASFDFYGTGFDVISMTDSTTGLIIVNVYAYNADGSLNSTAEKSFTVDTYYGYKYENGEWVTTTANDPNALYQVPVMKVDGLTYGKYQVKIVASYQSLFDHTNAGSYTFYLDAIRIYDPCGTDVVVDDNGTPDDTTDDVTVGDIYVQDGEGWPSYFEVRDQIIDKATFDSLNSETISGVVFIDGGISAPSVSDYTNYGPNNEVYLDAEQAIAFKLTASAAVGDVAKIRLAVKSVGGAGKIEVYGVDDEGNITACLAETISTATDMYYDITKLNGMNVVIKNAALSADTSNNAIISITNVKVTYTAEQTVTEEQSVETASVNVGNNDLETASYSLMSLRSSAPAISTMATTAEETVETTETETYLFSVSADGVAAVLMSLNVEEEEVEPEEPSEPEIPETPEEPEEPSEPEVPEEEEKPGKPEDHRKPGKGHHGKGHHGKGHGKYHRKKFDDQPGSDHGRRGH